MKISFFGSSGRPHRRGRENAGVSPRFPNRAYFAGGILAVSLWTAPVLHAKGTDWDSPSLWTVDTDDQSALTLRPGKGIDGLRLDIDYTLMGSGHRWAQIKRDWAEGPLNGHPLTFLFRGDGPAALEVKLTDVDGSNFVCRYPLARHGDHWEGVVLYKDSFDYGWGGNATLAQPRTLSLAGIGPAGSGTLSIDEIGLDREGLPATPTPDGPILDPHRNDDGFGFQSRRDRSARPEDPRVYAWLKTVQDNGSPDQRLLPSMEDNRAQTFNNALAAMVFILKDDRERAERILDFFSDATDPDNENPRRQNFFVKGEPRGFYQDMLLQDTPDTPAGFAPPGNDRWMGDMAWLLIAYRHYGRRYDPQRYARVTGLLTDLLVSFYKPAGPGGYVQHGWRRGDSGFHEPLGHPEGNIDAYAALRLAGREDLASNIRRWLDATVSGRRLPLDLYTWRVLALGPSYADLLSIPENDLRHRKKISVGGRPLWGFYHSASVDINNFWTDGIGHMACAYYSVGNDPRGHFYSNQLDGLLIDRTIDGAPLKSLPYTVNAEGGFNWVRTDRGFTSTAAWYIFAKNRFNPFTLTRSDTGR